MGEQEEARKGKSEGKGQDVRIGNMESKQEKAAKSRKGKRKWKEE